MTDITEITNRVRQLNSSIVVRKATLHDADSFVTLFNTYYKRKTTIDYFKWQFFDCPLPSALYMAFEGNILVGYYGIKKCLLSNTINAGFAVDFLIDEPYRKKGIAYLLEAEIVNFCQNNGIAVLTALPNTYGNAAFKALDWKSVSKIDTLIWTQENNLPTIEIPNHVDNLVSFSKDTPYKNWRFNENPMYNYEEIKLENNISAITKLFIDPVTQEIYGDLVHITNTNDTSHLCTLILKVLSEMKNKNLKNITAWALPHTMLYNLLLNLGFKNVSQERYFCVKVFDANFDYLYQISNWNLEECDAEIF